MSLAPCRSPHPTYERQPTCKPHLFSFFSFALEAAVRPARAPLYLRRPPPSYDATTTMSLPDAALTQILTQLEALQVSQQALQAKVCRCDASHVCRADMRRRSWIMCFRVML